MKRQHKWADMMRRWLDDDSLEVEIEHPYCQDWEFVAYPQWDENRNYRFKPKSIRCGDLEFPEPMRVAPSLCTSYWTAEITNSGIFIDRWAWANDRQDNRSLQLGICHLTSEAAEAHARALIALTEVK